MYEKITENVWISVEPSYQAEQSEPEERRFIWAYRVRIENRGASAVRLRSRHWQIIDGNGVRREVIGDGVVGQQPLLPPGGNYEYTSGTPLNTPTGFMTGTYTMEAANGQHFTVDIPAFSLDSPYQRVLLN